MKEGKKEEAETARARVAELKEGNKELDATMTQAATDMQNALYTIPNIPYDSVPEGVGAEDNVVEKMGGMETELPKDALPHWELAKKYDLRVLAVHVDAGWNSEIAVKNIEKMCKKLNYDLHTVVIDWPEEGFSAFFHFLVQHFKMLF